MFRLRNVGQVSFLTLLSRISGQLRSTLFAALFSTTALGDIVAIALKIPSLFRGILAEGALNAVFIPMLSQDDDDSTTTTNNNNTKLKKKESEAPKSQSHTYTASTDSSADSSTDSIHPSREQRFFFLFSLCFAASVFVTILGMIFADALSQGLYAFSKGGFVKDYETHLTAKAIRYAFPYLIGISLASLSAALLFLNRKFILASSLPLMQNVSLIVASSYALLFLTDSPAGLEQAILIIAAAASLGGLLQYVSTLPALFKQGMFRFRFQFRLPLFSWLSWFSPSNRLYYKNELRKLGGLFSPVALSSLLHQGQLLFIDSIALSLGAGSVSALFYANRILEFPLAIAVYAILTASFPVMSEQGAAYLKALGGHTLPRGKETEKSNFFTQERKETLKNHAKSMEENYRKTLSLIMMSSFAAAFWLLCSYETVISFVFGFGSFSQKSIDITSHCLLFYLFAIPLIALLRLLAQLSYALHKPSLSLKTYAISFPITLVLAFLFSRLYPEPASLALAALIGSFCSLGIFLSILSNYTPFPLLRQSLSIVFSYASKAMVPLICCYPLSLLTKPIVETIRFSTNNIWAVKLFELGELSFLLFMFLIFYALTLRLVEDKEFMGILASLGASSSSSSSA